MNNINLQQAQNLPANLIFNQQENKLKQIILFQQDKQATDIKIPFGKALKGSIFFVKDPADTNGNNICQIISIYRSTPKKYSSSIRLTNYSNVKVTQNKIHINLSMQLTDDPEKLKRQIQNFANIIIDETDEIAEMLNQDGAEKVMEAWNALNDQTTNQCDNHC